MSKLQVSGFKIQDKKGQMLIEAVIALSVLTVGFLGMFALLSESLGLNRVISDNYIGTYLAGEGIEVVKNIIDHNTILRAGGAAIPWNNGLGGDGCYEVSYDTQSLSQPFVSGNCGVAAAMASAHNLLFQPGQNLYSYSGSQATNFKRLVRVQLVGADAVKVNSVVSWVTRGGGAFSVDAEDHFFNWAPI
jgi:hypothetical protein